MATLAFHKTPLKLGTHELFEVAPGTRPIDWLLEHYPEGCGGIVLHWHGTERLLGPTYDDAGNELTPGHPDYLDRPIAAGDVCQLAVLPAEPISITTIIVTAVVTAVISAAVSIGLSLLFPDPGAPQAALASTKNVASPVYNVRSRQNLARLGEPVPAVYGSVLMTPDLCAAPYQLFDYDRGAHIDMLMCLGHGVFTIHEVLVGETEASAIEAGAVQYIVVPPSVHGGTWGTLWQHSLNNGWTDGFRENVWTSLEVGEQRFTNTNDSSGFYRVGRAGVSTGRWLIINLEWPRGLYQMAVWGSPTGTAVDWIVSAYPVDENGFATGPVQEHYFTEVGQNVSPMRKTWFIDLGYAAAWMVNLLRMTAQFPNGEEQNEFYWRGLMLQCETPGPAYGNVTLMMVRLNAVEVASTAERLVRVRVTRHLPYLGQGEAGPSSTPADAFADILMNQTYGARRPLAELDVTRLAALRTYWSPYEFNAAYTQVTTVWEALKQSVQGVAAAPMPISGFMSVAQDGLRPVRSMLFSEQNITRSSFKLSYHFEPTGAADGIEVEYVDSQTWAPAYKRWPTYSLAPDRVNLFGCSDANQALAFARLSWQRRQMLRRLVEFSTELEGLIPYPGERVAVAHSLPRWGASGFVAAAEAGSPNIMLDRVLPWDDYAGPFYMLFRDQYSGASNVVPVDRAFNGPHWARLLADPWAGTAGGWVISERQEGTHWVWGELETIVKDFTLTGLVPKGGPGATNVEVTGVIYDPDVYVGTLAFLQYPVP